MASGGISLDRLYRRTHSRPKHGAHIGRGAARRLRHCRRNRDGAAGKFARGLRDRDICFGIDESTALFAALKWAGVFYMLWLAYDIWRAKDQAEAQLAAESPMTTYVARGFLTNVLNPKAAVFFIAVLPQFIGPNTRFDRRFGYRWLKPS